MPRFPHRLISLLLVCLSAAACAPAGSPHIASIPEGASFSPSATPDPTQTPLPTETPTPTATPVAELGGVILDLVPLVTDIPEPLDIRHAGDGSGRLFVASRQGIIYVIQDGVILPEPFLNISDKVQTGGAEQGLLGMSFHPDYASNGWLFVNYTMSGGDTVIARYVVSGDNPNRVDPESEQMLMLIDQPFSNHNGGNLVFGPDGYLYIGLGDGGGGGDPDANGQDGLTLLGTMLRIDVSANTGYDIPADNPFIGNSNVRDEVWAVGLRNPWRYSFDRVTGDMYIADVGQGTYEEVNFVPADSPGGLNFGWNVMEGLHCYSPAEGCDSAGFEVPIVEYAHDEGCSVTGGYVYRGATYPDLWGIYFFGDYCSGRLWGLQRSADGAWHQQELIQRDFRISAFGEDEAGELYLASYGAGIIYRLVVLP